MISSAWFLQHLERLGVLKRQEPAPRKRKAVPKTASYVLPEFFYLHGGRLQIDLEWVPPYRKAGSDNFITSTLEMSCNLFESECVQQPKGEQEFAPPHLGWKLPDGTAAQRREKLELCVKEYARKYLERRLDDAASQYGLSYTRLRIGKQKSRWGSYSSRGSLSLNAKLIFLPPELSDYVILHELCHSINFSHDKFFWQTMQDFNPLSRELDKKLSSASVWIPRWFI